MERSNSNLFASTSACFSLAIPISPLDFSPNAEAESLLPLQGAGFKDVIEALAPTSHRDTISSALLETVVDPFRSSLQRYPWSVPTHHQTFLQNCGIDASGFGFKSHPHPVHKILETNLIHNTWSCLASTDSAVMFMKPSKFAKLQAAQPHFTELHNYRLVAKDSTRYPVTSSHVPNIETIFMHDTIMYYTPAQVLDLFLQSPKLQKLYASLVVPPESDFTSITLYPELYRFRFDGHSLVYELEQNPAHNYTQPKSALVWLKTTTIIGPDFSLTVSILDSQGPLHSLLIQRGEPPLHSRHDTAEFRTPPAILLPAPSSLNQDVRHRLVPKKVYDAVFLYVRTVRTLRVTDPAGFIRTQSSKAEHSWVTSFAWDNLAHFALQTASHRPRTTYYLFSSALARLSHWCRNHQLALSWASVVAISPAAALSSLSVSKFLRSELNSLAIFRRWIKAPPHFLFAPKAPFLSMSFRALRTGPLLFANTGFQTRLFPTAAQNFCSANPLLASFFPVKPLHRGAFLASLLAASVPVALLLVRQFVGPDSPQSMHDAYADLFHPADWRLIFNRKPLFASPEPFLPITTVPAPVDLPQIESIAIPAPSPAPPSPTSLAPTPIPPVTSTLDPAPASASAPAATPPAIAAPAPAPEPQAEALSLLIPSEHQPAAPPPIPELLPAAGQLQLESSGVVSNLTPAAPEPAAPEPSPLQADSSARGPVQLFSELFPGSYIGTTGAFNSRYRASGRAPTPYPAGTDCLLVTIEQATSISRRDLWETLVTNLPDCLLAPCEISKHGLSTDHFAVLAFFYSLRVTFLTSHGPVDLGMSDATTNFRIDHQPESKDLMGHFSLHQDSKPVPTLNGGTGSELATAATRFNLDGCLLPFNTVHTFVTAPSRAKNLISNMKNGFDGVLANIDPHHTSTARDRLLCLDGIIDVAKPRRVRLFHIAGFAGCGKSYPIARLLKTPLFREFKVAVPTVELRAEWKDLLKIRPGAQWRLSTWESSLLKSARILVIDEVYKMPRGYVDLAVHADPTIELVILLGDPLQGVYHSTHPSSTNSRLSPETHYLSKYIDFYCLWSHRIPQDVAKFFGVHSTNLAPGFSKWVPNLSPSSKILTNSQNSMKTLVDCGFASVTIASSQGSTYPGATNILLDRNSALLSHSNSLVALTRSKKGVVFTGDRKMLEEGPTSNLLFSRYFTGKVVSLAGLFPSELPKCPHLTVPLTSRSVKLSGAGLYDHAIPFRSASAPMIKSSVTSDVILDPVRPFLGDGDLNAPQISTHFLPETRRPLHFDIPSGKPSSDSPASAEPTVPVHEPVYPGETFENLAAHFLPCHDPEDREIHFRGQLSNQFPHINRPFELACQSSSLLAAVHSERDDPTLLPASIPKRLRFRPSSAPYRLTAKDEVLGSLLYEGLCRAYHRNSFTVLPFNETLYLECIALNEFAQLSSKTQSVIMANSKRSDPDWRYSAVRIFSKAQHKVNENSIFGNWKACQTLALMHDAVVLLLGPVKKYQRMFDAQDRPAHLYVHAGNTPAQMSSWCQNHLTDTVHLANDYTAFVQSQHGEAVVLERKKMERLSIPQALIDLHVFLKTNVETQFGPLTCMRLTGEPGTYDDNSDYNLAVINLEYSASHVPTMISGDDSLLDFEPPRRPEWSALEPLLALRFKKERDRYATFCGYYVGKAGAVRSPIALFAKLMIAVDDGSLGDKLISYLAEFAVGHSLGDPFWTLLPLEAVLFQSACFDFFCRRAPPALKISLKLGEVSESIMARLGRGLNWASSAVYSMLSSAQRRALLTSSRQGRSLPDNPEVSKLQGELLQSFQFVPQPSMNNSLLLPLFGGLSPSLAAHPMPGPNVTSQVGPAPPNDDRVDRQPSLPLAPRVAEVSPLHAHIDYPFQWEVGTYSGDKAAFVSDDLSASKTLKTLTAGYRHAEILSAEVDFVPLAPSFSKPISVGAVWTIASISPASAHEQSYYGGRLLTLGGPVLMSSTTRIPLDVSRINPVIKSSVSYSDTPRISYTVYSAAGTANTALISVIIRGIVRLSGPSGNTVA
ncbi:polyprotein [Blackberry virus S]|uniref:Polyprotein n=1 Tax=Blackberry virus S TaxID=670883 RepID=C8YZ25_9VIRU|nr:polyprotein [Blackberry virus S]ACV53023.1 polyprotein [Blackberry virus S]